MKKVAFHNLGCKVNSYETEYVQQQFKKRGYEIVQFGQKADIYVINTCTVTNIADRKSRQMIHKARKMNSDAVVIAMGCYVQTDTKGAANDPAIDILIGNNRKAETVDMLEEYLKKRGENSSQKKCIDVSDLTKKQKYENMTLDGSMEHTRVSVKIQDGCDQFCSYCAIPLARGRIRSRQSSDALNEIEALSKEGFMEIVLTGIHLSSYGLDFEGNAGNYNTAAASGEYTNRELLELIKKADMIPGIERIRLGSLEPRVITDEFLKGLKETETFCPHFHLSLQSGCDSVLKRMNRHYSAVEFLGKIRLIRKYFPDAAIMTDVITGFPKESDEEFEICRKFLEEADFFRVHVFKYSRREGTVADAMDGQISEHIKEVRSELLIKDSAVRERDFAERLIGENISVLLEDEEIILGQRYRLGYTKNYVRCALKADACPKKGIVETVGGAMLTDEILEVYIEK